MSRKNGLFCVFEGIDGAGKSTLIQNLYQQWQRQNQSTQMPAIVLREPSALPSGQKISALLAKQAELPPQSWLELFIADRKQNLQVNVLPACAASKVILQDRYFYSTAAYQGIGDIAPHDIIAQNRQHGFQEPDLLFFIELDAQSAYARIQKQRQKQESFEKLEHLQEIAQNYKKILPPQTIHLDGKRDTQHLCQQALEHLLQHLKDTCN